MPSRTTRLLLFALAVIIIAGFEQSKADDTAHQPWIIGVQHIHISVTVWSDGSIDMSDPAQLTARSARRLANRLEDAADERRRRQRDTTTAPLPQPSPERCTAVAVSTGQQCRNRTVRLQDGKRSQYCSVHKQAPK